MMERERGEIIIQIIMLLKNFVDIPFVREYATIGELFFKLTILLTNKSKSL